ncbi:MAG TPA: OmpW family outer membrane protein [Nitrospiria bacterium]|nr:OmpW family outer membrane protein [Nitrospiria bacterium]
MKRIVSLVAILMLGPAAPAHALIGPETSLGVRLGTGVFQRNNLFGEATDIQNPTVVGLTAGIRQGRLGGEISADWISADLETGIKVADLTVTPILLTAQFHPVVEDTPFDPYFGVGMGYYINSARAGAETKAKKAASGIPNYSVQADNSVGVHFGVGANVKISSALAFAIDARYAFVNTRLNEKGGGFSDGSTLNMSGLVATVGLKYYFPK